MWKDSETELDFLDYDYLIKTIQYIITNNSLLPASIGVYGDWGSGKSSLMHMSKKCLECGDKNIKCLVFNGWLFENYEDAKTAILGSILDEISAEQNLPAQAKTIIKSLYKSIDKFELVKKTLKVGTDIALSGGVATLIEMAGKKIVDNFKSVEEDGNLKTAYSNIIDELNNKELREDIRKFQADFSRLLEESKISKLVVFIDELDRCRPDTILDTLEAIKLFLFNGNVAFVIGADERHIAYAVKSKFKDIEGIQIDIGKEYLEKLIQYPIRIPQLNAEEVEVYIACLLLQSDLGEIEFNEFITWLIKSKQTDFENFKLKDAITLFNGNLVTQTKVIESISIANQLASVLSNGLHGNPRQCKRFLNSMYMRLQMANFKNKTLDRKILAKIMMLEYIKPRVFNIIAEMAANNTLSKELDSFENGKSNEGSTLSMWSEDEWFIKWCKIEPKLSNENTNIYFYFTRTSLDEKISRISYSLSPTGQKILEDLLSKTDVKINNALKLGADISPLEAVAICEAMYTKMCAETSIDNKIMSAFLDFAKSKNELITETLSYLNSFAGSQINLGSIGYIVAFAKGTGKVREVRDIATHWGKSKSEVQRGIDSLLDAIN